MPALTVERSGRVLIPKIDVLDGREIGPPEIRGGRAEHVVGLEGPQLRVGVPPGVAHDLRCG